MDTKNDDSAGSDSLDKSLQKKCVVDDVGQGEGTSGESNENNGRTLTAVCEQNTDNSTNNYKTEKSVGDGGGGAVGGSSDVLSCAPDVPLDNLSDVQAPSERTFSKESEAANTASTSAIANVNVSASTSNSTTNHNNNNNAFETKVKQISKNLKETTLAETANKKTTLEDSTSSSSSSSSASDYEQAVPSSSPQGNSNSQAPDSEFNLQGANESLDDHDHRSKKVRFHPDVKENDGGNRVVPKKKKKLKGTQGGEESGSNAAPASGNDDEMDVDEEEDDLEEEEEFDMAKTMSEAEAYLKSHPLTFVRPHDKTVPPLKNGLLEEDDVKELREITPEVRLIQQTPENGVERILGKQIRCGKTEFLVCYADRSILAWESEEFILKNCPNLLHSYEQNREKRQERLMLHVAKRQNVRQRYTDF